MKKEHFQQYGALGLSIASPKKGGGSQEHKEFSCVLSSWGTFMHIGMDQSQRQVNWEMELMSWENSLPKMPAVTLTLMVEKKIDKAL